MLATIIPIIEQMTYDELRDFIDYCEYTYLALHVPASKNDIDRDKFRKQVKNRRSGLPSGGFPDDFVIAARGTKTLTMTTDLQKAGLSAVQDASKSDLITVFGKPSTAHDTSAAIAWVLLRAKAPIRKQSQGNIQVKEIPYKRVRKQYNDDGILEAVRDENGKPIVDDFKAKYLYLRYWTVQGDSDRTMKRYQNVYIGGNDGDNYIYRDLAIHFHDTIQTYGKLNTRQVTSRKTGEITMQAFRTRPRNEPDNPISILESRIMDCIDMSTEPPIINHDCLQELQSEIMSEQ